AKRKTQELRNNRKRRPQEQEANNSQSKKQKRKMQIFAFGNYRNYYGCLIGPGLEEDPRLKVLMKGWFEGKDCLDIGCNNGLLTITLAWLNTKFMGFLRLFAITFSPPDVAIKFNCKNIVGIDMDGDRLEDAYWQLRKFARQQNTGNAPSKSCKLEDQGGILILEPQPWDSYIKNYQVSEIEFSLSVMQTATANYNHIKIHRQEFQDILLDKVTAFCLVSGVQLREDLCDHGISIESTSSYLQVGFITVENVTSNLQGSKSGFNRPILTFRR
ncbi:RNA methyltransferase bin3, C-terminal, partial [Dillenia turbinata]